MKQVSYNTKFEDAFFRHLAALVEIKTCFWMDDKIEEAIAYCFSVVGNLPIQWIKKVDDHGNLIIYNTNYDLTKPILYLSSHIDTVGANETDWQYPAFEATIANEYIIGRGVNDCKAGTAFQLSLLEILGTNINYYNIGFMIMYREEGNQGKTSSHIDFSKLPTSPVGNYFMTLENTVSIVDEQIFEIGVYNKEPHNLYIKLDGTLPELQNDIEKMLSYKWKPVAIEPIPQNLVTLRHTQTLYNSVGGHAATKVNSILIDLLRRPTLSNTAIKAGKVSDVSVIAREINLYKTAGNRVHTIIYNYRGFEAIKDVNKFLRQFTYDELFDFKHGLGSDQSEAFNSSMMPNYLRNASSENTPISITANPGRSDASAIFNNLDEEQRIIIIPFACGPGCRSHIDKQNIKHSTHGENEGFYKPSAKKSIPFFLNIIDKFKN